MAQLNWTYYSLTGQPYLVDMYHGDDSGHLMLFVNGEIIMIDFNQKDPSKHNFFIENQLIELDIKRDGLKYDYALIPQKMPEVQSSEKLFTKHFWIPLIMLIIALNLIGYLLVNTTLG